MTTLISIDLYIIYGFLKSLGLPLDSTSKTAVIKVRLIEMTVQTKYFFPVALPCGTNLHKAEEPTEREAEEIRTFSAVEDTKIAPVFCQDRIYLNYISDDRWKGLCYVRN